MQTKKTLKYLFWIVMLGGIMSIIITFYNTVILRDYEIVEVE